MKRNVVIQLIIGILMIGIFAFTSYKKEVLLLLCTIGYVQSILSLKLFPFPKK